MAFVRCRVSQGNSHLDSGSGSRNGERGRTVGCRAATAARREAQRLAECVKQLIGTVDKARASLQRWEQRGRRRPAARRGGARHA